MHSSRTHVARRRPLAAGPSQSAALRLAFTLLELLISISIIAILAGLILTVASSAMIRAHNAQVSADIQSLSAGIAAFKQRFSVEPPSSIYLYEQASGWTNDPRSMSLIRQIWPQFDFTYAAYSTQGNAVDINGNGTTNDVISLNGAECLVFFMGGIPAGSGGAPMGFSLNPADPFNVPGVGVNRQVVGTNREKFADFDASRLFLYPPANTTTSGILYHSMNTYKDTLTGQQQPYLYLSSYGGQGYNLNELVGSPALGTNAPGQTFVDVFRQGPQGYWLPTNAATPYAPPYQPESGQNLTANTNAPSPAWNANSFQIISPGGDQKYGVGGEYESANGNALLVLYPGATAVDRSVERDNITNFSSGTLASQ